jgi:hypothetical protein
LEGNSGGCCMHYGIVCACVVAIVVACFMLRCKCECPLSLRCCNLHVVTIDLICDFDISCNGFEDESAILFSMSRANVFFFKVL